VTQAHGRPDRRTARAVAIVLSLVFATALIATIASAQQTEEPVEEDAPEIVQAGADLYGEHCAICHGVAGRGTEDAPPITNAPPALMDFVIRTGRMPLPNPNARVERREPVLDDDEREAVVAYGRTFGPEEPDVPDPDPEAGDLVLGRELYETNCIACHSPFGGGIAVSQEDIAPALGPADEVEIAQAIRAGPGVMPVFGPEHLDEHDVDSVIRYVMFLRDRPAPGGVRFGRSGPVTEGLMAWFVGLGLLTVMAYFIGEKRE
jgi:ubiquinol-cytochrome c reductase cytochrome c subunit